MNFFQKKCEHFTDENVREAFIIICADEMLIKKEVPDYKRIVNVLNKTIAEVSVNSVTEQFDQLSQSSSSCEGKKSRNILNHLRKPKI